MKNCECNVKMLWISRISRCARMHRLLPLLLGVVSIFSVTLGGYLRTNGSNYVESVCLYLVIPSKQIRWIWKVTVHVPKVSCDLNRAKCGSNVFFFFCDFQMFFIIVHITFWVYSNGCRSRKYRLYYTWIFLSLS